MSEELLKSVASWVEKSGRALEMRVARTARQQGANSVTQSFTYLDANTEQIREGDVVATFSWTGANNVPCGIELAVECKSSKEGAWVAFLGDAQTMARVGTLEDWLHYQHGPFTAIHEPLNETWRGRAPFDSREIASHVVQLGKENNPAGDAVRQALSAAEAFKAEYIRTHHQDRRGVFIIAAVVTSAPLVTCRLDHAGELDLRLAQTFVVPGHVAAGKPSRVYVMTEAAFPDFCGSLRLLADAAGHQALLGGNG